MIPQGLDSKINGIRVVTFSTLRGVFETCSSTPTLKGCKCVFTVIKELKGLLYQASSRIFRLILYSISVMLLTGFISMFKTANVRMTGAEGGFHLK